MTELQLDLGGLNGNSDSHAPAAAADIDSLTGINFEVLVMRLLSKMGFDVQETKATGDGGVDIVVRSSDPISGGLYIVQCKRHSSNIGEPVVRDLYGVVYHTHASKGILITNSEFTRQARDFSDGKPLELINGDTLRALLGQYGLSEHDSNDEKVFRHSGPKRALSKGLTRLAKDARLALEVDTVHSSAELKRYPFPELFRKLTYSDSEVSICETFEKTVLKMFEMLAEGYHKESTLLAPEEVKYRLEVAERTLKGLLKRRRAILDLSPEVYLPNVGAAQLSSTRQSSVVRLKESIVGALDAILRDACNNLLKLDETWELLDGQHPEGGDATVNVDLRFAAAQPWYDKIVAQSNALKKDLRKVIRRAFWQRLFFGR